MALQVLKEAKLPVARCRLSPPNSPSRRSSVQAGKRPAYTSKILRALDAGLEGLDNDNQPPVVVARTVGKAPLKAGDVTQADSSDSFPHILDATGRSSKEATLKNTVACISQGTINTTLDVDIEHAEEMPGESMPFFSYKECTPAPAVVYTRHEEEANDLVQCLDGPLGFDMEWRVFFRRIGPSMKVLERKTALIQLCDAKMIVLIQISAMKNDGMKLYRDFGILPRNLVELGAFAHRADKTFKDTYSRTIVSLVRMTEKYLNQTVDKPAVRTGNWEVQPLSEEQIHYAANDAYSSLMIYKKLWELATDQLPQEESTQILKHYIDLRSEHSEGKLDKATSSASTARPTTASAVIKATASSNTGVVSSTSTTVLYFGPATPQQMKAYTLWHHDGMSLDDMCVALNAEKPVLRATAM
ncbi:hypothetical protein PHLCEN_2v11999 [Hermanssonia centrifuga]|uniref:3'-5' exonuclease domain-containing protein n=1 Tax=Hermanssonia centrifuga TaxID=98765 RepID=A0A2R6NIM7_9APHY|nr:hypothetical protein PHLCEN_2v11999 [Hermanssonia centrifuga]